MTGGGVHGESGDAVMAAIADVKEFPRGRQVDLGAGIPCGVPVGQGAGRLHARERTRRTVEAIEADAAALLIGEIDEVPSRMEAVVARADEVRLLDPGRRIGCQTAGISDRI